MSKSEIIIREVSIFRTLLWTFLCRLEIQFQLLLIILSFICFTCIFDKYYKNEEECKYEE